MLVSLDTESQVFSHYLWNKQLFLGLKTTTTTTEEHQLRTVWDPT